MDTPLRRIRRQKKLTLETLARAVRFHAGNLSRLERGKQRATPEIAAALAKFYKGEISELEILYPERYERRSRNNSKRAAA